MPDDRFDARLRALAKQLSRSLSETDLGEVADRLGVDRDRVQGAADAAQEWLEDRAGDQEPLFGATAPDPAAYEPSPQDPSRTPRRPASRPPSPRDPLPAASAGPHPLDPPTDLQGRALSALDSGRWTLRPGAGVLSGTGVAPEPPQDPDLTGDLRARDWIAADGAVTLAGRQALLRWCAAAAAPSEAGARPDETPGTPAGSDASAARDAGAGPEAGAAPGA